MPLHRLVERLHIDVAQGLQQIGMPGARPTRLDIVVSLRMQAQRAQLR
jgi:hypothetical protein